MPCTFTEPVQGHARHAVLGAAVRAVLGVLRQLRLQVLQAGQRDEALPAQRLEVQVHVHQHVRGHALHQWQPDWLQRSDWDIDTETGSHKLHSIRRPSFTL